jgi:hypothetical protein
MAVPLALGLIHALYAPLCAGTLLTLCAVRRARLMRVTPRASGKSPGDRMLWLLPLIATLASALPPLVRPLLDGDSLAYHLPNAAAWVHAGSIWTTSTRYWWYPGGSELFAAALFAVAGPFSIGLAGVGPVLLLGTRVATWTHELGCTPWTAGAIGAAVITTTPITLQAGNLDNDVWLGAFFLETLWAGTCAPGAMSRSVAACALLKPSGFLYALAAAAAAKRAFNPGFLSIAVWLARDAVLWAGALHPLSETSYPNLFGTTILGHGLPGLALLGHVILTDGPATLLVLSAGSVGALALGDRRLVNAGAAAFLLFLLTPFGFSIVPFGSASDVPQLATGYSLRLLIPFFAVCGIGLASLGRRLPHLTSLVALFAAFIGSVHLETIYWNDAHTHVTPAILALFTVLCFIRAAALRTRLITYALASCVVAAGILAASGPAAYYNDWLRRGDTKARLFTWLSDECPSRTVVSDLRAGAVNVVCPQTDTIDALDASACAQARSKQAVLIDGVDAASDPRFHARRDAAIACGRMLFQDSSSVAVRPRYSSGAAP